MRRAILSGFVTGDAAVSYWPIFSLSPVTVPEVFAKVNSVEPVSLLVSKEANCSKKYYKIIFVAKRKK